ncbi:MAG: hypothetical protein ACQEWV_19055 [Bacillota bacterium]
MLKMANIELIRKLHFKEGRPIRQLAKDLGYSRQTIRKALEDSEITTYTRKAPYAKHSVGPYIPVIIITEWLKSDRTAPTKQRHTAAQIYRRLVKEYEFPSDSDFGCHPGCSV